MAAENSAARSRIGPITLLVLSGYRIASIIVLMLILPFVPLLKRYSRRINDGFADFFGLVPRIDARPVLWVHGVSMGESMVAAGFAVELQKRFKSCQIVFTTTHPDVLANVKKRGFAGAAAYFPLDNYFAMRNIFRRWRPAAVFVAETDFWPEFSYQCRRRQIPLILINGRISAKLARFYQTFSSLAGLIFGAYSLFAVQSRVDADRLLAIGTTADKIKILGNMKADLTTNPARASLDALAKWLNGRRCVIFGSLHPDEFEQLKTAFTRLAHSHTALIIAPRNPANAEKWLSELIKLRLTACLRSGILPDTCSDVVLVDTMGELSAMYALATVAMVGGSLNSSVGGHNPLEVIQQQVPLLMGSHCRNFADLVAQLQQVGGIISCKDADSILAAALALLNDPSLAAEQVAGATQVLKANAGAVAKTLAAVVDLLPDQLE